MADQTPGGLTHEDREWLSRQLELTRVEQPTLTPTLDPTVPSVIDQVMPYVPALLFALCNAAGVWVLSMAADSPRVWPGTIFAFVVTFLNLAYLTWRRCRRAKASGRRG